MEEPPNQNPLYIQCITCHDIFSIKIYNWALYSSRNMYSSLFESKNTFDVESFYNTSCLKLTFWGMKEFSFRIDIAFI